MTDIEEEEEALSRPAVYYNPNAFVAENVCSLRRQQMNEWVERTILETKLDSVNMIESAIDKMESRLRRVIREDRVALEKQVEIMNASFLLFTQEIKSRQDCNDKKTENLTKLSIIILLAILLGRSIDIYSMVG